MSTKRQIRNITACRRCRQRRVKCDKQFPKCGNCLRKGDECVSLDPGTGEVIGRSYVYDLERQVEKLKNEINLLKRQTGGVGARSNSNGNATNNNDNNDNNNNNIGSPFEQEKDINGNIRFSYQKGPYSTSQESGSTHDSSINYKVLMMRDDDIVQLKQIEPGALPPISLVEECLVLYFRISNVQLPILNREYFLSHYLKPLYGDINPSTRKKMMDSSLTNLNNFNHYNYQNSHTLRKDNNSSNHRRKCLFFIHIIIAILTSILQQKYSLSVSFSHQQQSLKYAEYIWNEVDVDDSEISKLEMIQSLLLLSTYSIMRPSNPGAWYLIGNSVRLLYDLNLHEDPQLLTSDLFLRDVRRQIFWSCYALDQQVSLYFQKPYAIRDHNVEFPSVLDDFVILTERQDGSSIGADTESNRVLIPDTNKLITHQYIKLRLIQNKVNSLPQDIPSREPMEAKLHQWYKESINLTFDEFNRSIMELNYRFSLTLLYSFLLFKGKDAIDNLDSQQFGKYETIFKSSERVIFLYDNLQNKLKLLNYSWVSINNIFLAGITYLFAIYCSEPIRATVDLTHLTTITELINNFLNNLKPICLKQCEACINQFNEFKSSVFDLIDNERLLDLNIDFDHLFANSDFINSMVGSVNSLDNNNNLI